jgi:hypothetical protein
MPLQQYLVVEAAIKQFQCVARARLERLKRQRMLDLSAWESVRSSRRQVGALVHCLVGLYVTLGFLMCLTFGECFGGVLCVHDSPHVYCFNGSVVKFDEEFVLGWITASVLAFCADVFVYHSVGLLIKVCFT